jgi:hypothetical protein
MPHLIVIIELINNKFEALYSDSELSFILVNHTKHAEEMTISGPHEPTLPKADLAKVIDGVTILNQILEQDVELPKRETP